MDKHNCNEAAATDCSDAGPIANISDQSVAGDQDDNLLIANVYDYLAENRYPVGASTNKKRIIRRKAQRFNVRNGELLYIKRIRKVSLQTVT